jgi:serine/threonine-protein kinase RsbW
MEKTGDRRVLELEYAAERRIVHDAREKLVEFVRPCRLSADDLDALKVALSEACANAVCHGSPRGALNHVHVRYEVRDQCLSVEVEDEGCGFRPASIALPDSSEFKPSGRGVFIMKTLMDDVEYEPTSHGTRVRLTKRLPRREVGAEMTPESMMETSSLYARLQPATFHEGS